MKKDDPYIQKFIDVFCYSKYLEYWNDEEEDIQNNNKIYIADPSHITAILYTDKLVETAESDTGWMEYSYKGWRPSKKATNYFYFDGYFYSGVYIMDILNGFFKDRDNHKIRIIRRGDTIVLLFEINGELSIGIANKKDETIRIEDGKVCLVDCELKPNKDDNYEFVEVGKTYAEWDNGKATFIKRWYSKEYKVVVYDQAYLFTKQEEIGDSLLI